MQTNPPITPPPPPAPPLRRFLKPCIVAAVVILIASGTLFGLAQTGVDPLRAITEARCRSGAFITHSQQASTINDAHHQSGSSALGVIEQPLAKTTGPNLIPNSGIETGQATPTGWKTATHGQNNASFSQVPGHASARGLRVEASQYTDGAANWYYQELSASPGGYYEFSVFYRSSVSTRPILMIQSKAAPPRYIDLRPAAPSATWIQYHTTFFVPQDTERFMIYQPLTATGWIETDDYSLRAAQPQGFQRPLVSLTFDDGWKSIHDQALPLLKRYSMPSTQYLVSGYLGQTQAYMALDHVYNFRQAGHEIASHTVNHANLTQQPESLLQFELQRSHDNLAKCFAKPLTFAAPYGAYNVATTRATQRLYQTARSTDTGYNTADNLDPYRLQVQNMTTQTTAAEVQSWLDLAKANRAWLILVYHQVDDTASDYARRPADLERDLSAIKSSGVTVKTVSAAYAELKPQLP